MPVRKFNQFDSFAEDYRKVHTENIKLSGADSLYFAKMKVDILAKHEKNILLQFLDIGCGDGQTEVHVQKIFPTWIVHGLDISAKSIAVAKSREILNANFKKFDGQSIPLAEESVDVVFIAGVLHHVNFHFHQALLKEINRVMKIGGRIYLFEHNPLNPLTRYLVNTCVFDADAKLLYPGYAMRILKKSGFTRLRKEFIIFFPRNGILSYLIWSEKYLNWLPLGGQYFIKAVK